MSLKIEEVKSLLYKMRLEDGSEHSLALFYINRLTEDDIPSPIINAYTEAKTEKEKRKILRDAYTDIVTRMNRRGVVDPDKCGIGTH